MTAAGATEVDALDLTVRARNALANAGIQSVAEACALGPGGLRRMPAIGKVTLVEIGRVLFNEDWSPRTRNRPATNPALAEFSNQQLRAELAARRMISERGAEE